MGVELFEYVRVMEEQETVFVCRVAMPFRVAKLTSKLVLSGSMQAASGCHQVQHPCHMPDPRH